MFSFFQKKNNIKPVVLVIMDGFGLAPASSGNAISLAKTPNYDYLIKNYPHSSLIASGESVGLPANEVGNTEVGHLTIGAGRTILQDLKRISLSIEKGTFYDNRALLKTASHLKQNASNFHILSLISSGRVHSSMDHLLGLVQFCKKESLDRVFLHIFTDGRDAPPKEGIKIVSELEAKLKSLNVGKIASISGRYYAMDRDRRWERTQKAYDAIVSGQGIHASNVIEAIQSSYDKNITDEFMLPTVITENGQPKALINDNDAVVFANFRVDRPKQLTMALVLPDFENLHTFDFGYDPEISKEIGKVKISATFRRGKIPANLFVTTMTEYQKNLPVSAVIFPPEIVEKPMSEIISQAGLKQLHASESEKERFVKYYFNGMREDPMPGEEDLVIPSPKVPTYDKKPEMSLPKLTKSLIAKIRKNKYNFIVVNFANPDMVGHTGDLKATIKAIELVDKYLIRIIGEILKRDGVCFVTADHGNAEELISYPASSFFVTSNTGSINTDHSNNPVPLLFISNRSRGIQNILNDGALCDIAPTIMNFMGIKIPPEMTGKNLLGNTKS